MVPDQLAHASVVEGQAVVGSREGVEGATRLDLTVVVLTFNEARHIERAIASVLPIAGQVVVIDSFSTDDTVARAESMGARVLQHRFINHAHQFQWGIDHAGITTGWIMRLDADEVIEPDLATAISCALPDMPADVAGINLDRKHIFMGRWIRHGGRYPVRLVRLFRRGQGRIEQRWMDEHIVVWGGRTITLTGGFQDDNLNDLTYFTAKHNGYATREAIEVLSQRHGLFCRDEAFSMEAVSKQAGIKRLVKERVYNRLPFWVGPLAYFIYRYVIRLGFLDGREGMIYHVLQGGWYRFLVGAKVMEFERALAGCRSNEERLARLAQLTELRFDA